jgi:hypothetical protein
MFVRSVIFSLIALFATTAAAQIPDYRDLATFGSYLQQHRKTYSAYATEKADLLKLSDSRDPAQITAEFQSKLGAITTAYQDIYNSKVAAINAGIGVATSMLSSEWQQLGGLAGSAVGGLIANAEANSAETKAYEDRRQLSLEFEEKFFTLKEEVLMEKRNLLEFYLMAAAFQLSEAEEKKHLDLANYLDCECRYIEDNFSLGSASWLNSNCPRPAISKYAAVAAPQEPTADVLLATIKRKLSVPNIHFIRAARDFADIGMAKYPKNSDFLFYRIYLSEDPNTFDLMLINELLKSPAHKTKALALKKYIEEHPINALETLEHTKTLSVGVQGNPRIIITKTQLQNASYIYPAVRGNKMVYVLPDGSPAFDEEFDYGTYFQGGYARVQQAGKWGMIDKTGKRLIPCIYANLMASMYVAKSNYYDFYRATSACFSSAPFSHFDEHGYVGAHRITGHYGILSIHGQWIIEPEEFEVPLVLGADRFLRLGNGYWQIFDAAGKRISNGDYTLDNAKRRIQWIPNVIDGWFKIPVKYNMAFNATKWTFMDIDGNYVWGVDVAFDEIIDDGFTDGKCKVRQGKGKKAQEFYIDKTGKRID